MEPKKITHFLYCPLTGLGLYGGHRGSRWLRNRIKIFKQFVVPSLLAQTSKNFILWISVRHQDHFDRDIQELRKYLETITEFKTVFTYAGICFWDDKFPNDEAKKRLSKAVHDSIAELFSAQALGACDYVYMTIQPSDDVYHREFVEQIQKLFIAQPELQAIGFTKGYIANYRTLEVAEYNPTTNPPFYTIKFPTPIFIEPYQHIKYTGPYKSHEYVPDKLKFGRIEERGFIVGCHGENLSTHFNQPFKGVAVHQEILKDFGLENVLPLKLKISMRKALMRRLPYGWQRKLRYRFGERLYARIYDFLRS